MTTTNQACAAEIIADAFRGSMRGHADSIGADLAQALADAGIITPDPTPDDVRLSEHLDSNVENLATYAKLLESGEDPETEDLGPLDEYFLEIIEEVGRPFTAVITVGGPHIELVFDHTGNSARVVGVWGGPAQEVHLPGDYASTLFDYLFPEHY